MADCSAELARQRFFRKASGSFWNHKLKIVEDPDGDRRVITTEPITHGEVLVVLTPECLLSREQAQRFCSLSLADLNPALHLTALLYLQFSGHSGDPLPLHREYIAALPTTSRFEAFHPLCELLSQWDERKLASISHLFGAIEEWLELKRWAQGQDAIPFNNDALLRAHLCVTSRAWSVGLVPWIDFFNHADDGSLLSTEASTIIASRPYQAGQEVNTSYGLKSSVHLLCNYGFMPNQERVLLLRPDASAFARALDPELNDYNATTSFLTIAGDPSGLDLSQLLAPFRLAQVDRYDSIHIDDLHSAYLSQVSIANEWRAIQQALAAIKAHQDYLQNLVGVFAELSSSSASAVRAAAQGALALLDGTSEQLQAHWSSLLPLP